MQSYLTVSTACPVVHRCQHAVYSWQIFGGGHMRLPYLKLAHCSGSDSDDNRLTQLQAVFAVKDVLPLKR